MKKIFLVLLLSTISYCSFASSNNENANHVFNIKKGISESNNKRLKEPITWYFTIFSLSCGIVTTVRSNYQLTADQIDGLYYALNDAYCAD